eukprot:2351077-Prymnesium_polylepis.1
MPLSLACPLTCAVRALRGQCAAARADLRRVSRHGQALRLFAFKSKFAAVSPSPEVQPHGFGQEGREDQEAAPEAEPREMHRTREASRRHSVDHFRVVLPCMTFRGFHGGETNVHAGGWKLKACRARAARRTPALTKH